MSVFTTGKRLRSEKFYRRKHRGGHGKRDRRWPNKRQLFWLTVLNGTGGGRFKPDTVCPIAADADTADAYFNQWQPNDPHPLPSIDDTQARETFVTKAAQHDFVVATFLPFLVLTVENGSGSGSFRQTAQPEITADAPPAGKVFDHWEVVSGDVTFGDDRAETTTVEHTETIEAATVRAVFALSGPQPGSRARAEVYSSGFGAFRVATFGGEIRGAAWHVTKSAWNVNDWVLQSAPTTGNARRFLRCITAHTHNPSGDDDPWQMCFGSASKWERNTTTFPQFGQVSAPYPPAGFKRFLTAHVTTRIESALLNVSETFESEHSFDRFAVETDQSAGRYQMRSELATSDAQFGAWLYPNEPDSGVLAVQMSADGSGVVLTFTGCFRDGVSDWVVTQTVTLTNLRTPAVMAADAEEILALPTPEHFFTLTKAGAGFGAPSTSFPSGAPSSFVFNTYTSAAAVRQW